MALSRVSAVSFLVLLSFALNFSLYDSKVESGIVDLLGYMYSYVSVIFFVIKAQGTEVSLIT